MSGTEVEVDPYTPGAVVYVEHRNGLSRTTVARTTKAHIITPDGAKFRRQGGYRVGDGAWDHNVLRAATPELAAQWMREQRIARAQRTARQVEDRIGEWRRIGRLDEVWDAMAVFLDATPLPGDRS